MKKINFNEKCIVRHQDCKRLFEGSRICFVACPNSEEIALELEIIKQKLREVNIEPYIAVDNRDFQKDIFCEKICTKIIESQFCIVVLNDVIDKDDKITKPNANVYYEYGLMTAFKKRIIPIQLKDQKLAFNIQSLDTLKYDRSNFSKLIEEAIKITLLGIEEENLHQDDKLSINYDWALDIIGLARSDERFRMRHERALNLRTIGFQPYIKPKDGRLYLVGIFDSAIPNKDIIIRTKILTIRLKNYSDQIESEIKERDTKLIRTPYTEARYSEFESTFSFLREAMILIIKEGLTDKDLLKEEYINSIEDVGLELDLMLMNENDVNKIICA